MSERVFQWKIMSSHKARPNHSSTKFQTFKLSYTNNIHQLNLVYRIGVCVQLLDTIYMIWSSNHFKKIYFKTKGIFGVLVILTEYINKMNT